MRVLSPFLLLLLRAAGAHLRSHRKLARASDQKERIDRQYIVLFREGVDVEAKAASLAEELGDSNVLFKYTDDVKGVALSNVDVGLLQRILEDDDTTFAEEDQKVYALGYQDDPSWGLDRIDESGIDDKYHYEYTGSGVTVFVVDTGILSGHEEFGGRVKCGHNAFSSLDCNDGQGHGTHIAGIIGGKTYGVAKNVDLVSVRVLSSDGTGTVSQAIAGLDYIKSEKTNNGGKPMIANLSLGGGSSRALDKAVRNVAAAGIVVVVAAGNRGVAACSSSPAKVNTVITVGALNNQDRRPNFSNYGSCVDIFAPGVNIKSAWSSSNSASSTLTGTSMAAPFVAGVAALYLEANPSWTHAQVWQAMKNDATRLRDASSLGVNSPNLVLSTPKFVAEPSSESSAEPSAEPSSSPTSVPSEEPSGAPSSVPTSVTSSVPSGTPSASPSSTPSVTPSFSPSGSPSTTPSSNPSSTPSAAPSSSPSAKPSATPSSNPGSYPSYVPSEVPSASPSVAPSVNLSSQPSGEPNASPSSSPSANGDDRQFDDSIKDPTRIHYPGGKDDDSNACGVFLSPCEDNSSCCGNTCLRFMGFCLY